MSYVTLRLPAVLRLRQEEGREADARGARGRPRGGRTGQPRGDGARRRRRCTSTASGPRSSSRRDVGVSGFQRTAAAARRRHLQRLRGRPAALAGRPARRAAAQRGRGAAATDGDPLEAMLDFSGPTTAPEDPVLARLFPTAYRDDEEAAGEFRRFTESGCATARRDAAADHRRPRGGRPAARAGRGRADHRRRARRRPRPSLAAVAHRPAAGARPPASRSRRATRTYWASLPEDDPRAQVHDIYDWLGYLQETLVERRLALSRGVAGTAPGGGRLPDYPGPVLTIDQATHDAIVAHAKRDHPDEACGIVAGPRAPTAPSGSSRWSTRPARRRSTSSTPTRPARALQARWTTATRSRWSSTTRTPPPRPTRAAPTSAWPASPTPTTCWSAPVSTGIRRPGGVPVATGSSTAR